MKFGQHLTSHVTPEWRTQYINYDMLKGMILKLRERAASTETNGDLPHVATPVSTPNGVPPQMYDEFETHFFEYSVQELNKVNTFWNEKLAEAQRKFSALKTELRAHRGKRDSLTQNELKIQQKLPWFVDFVDKDARRAKRRYRKIHDLKLAFSEFYLSLILLQNFQNLNFTGFRKILKKHDKILHTDSGAVWRKEHVEGAPFYTNKAIDDLILETENLVTNELEGGDRGRAMRRLRVPPLNEQASPSVFFLMGLFLGIFLILLVVLILTGYFIGLPNNEYTIKNMTGAANGSEPLTLIERKEKTDWRIVIRLYRGPFLLIAMLFLLAFNVHGWRAAGVNHVLIFELDPRNHLSQHHIMELAACMGVLWCISLLLFFYSDFLGISHYAIPVIISGLMLAFLINPLHVLFFDARRWLMRTTFRIVTAPFHAVAFADFWLADQFTSLTPALLDIEYFICFYSYEVPWYTGGVPSNQNMCMSNSNAIRPIVAALPAWFRFAQCLRRYRDSRLAFPHLVNASRYSLSFFVVLFSALNSMHVERYVEDYIAERPVFYLWVISAVASSCFSFWWDIRMDWGFLDRNAKEHRFLRDSLIYSSSWYYYATIVQDFILRFAWAVSISVNELGLLHFEIILTVLSTTEIIRRFIWNYFRLENEHLNNCGEFRAVRDIAVTQVKKKSSPLLVVHEEPTESDFPAMKKERYLTIGRRLQNRQFEMSHYNCSSRKFHSIWKMDQEEARRDQEIRPGNNAELFPISIPDPSYNPEEEDDDKTEDKEEVLINVEQ